MRRTAITPRITIIMTDIAKLLRLQSWLSPAFPIGAFSYSHALEWAVEQSAVTDRITLVDWLEADLRHGSGRNDAILLHCAWNSVDRAANGDLGEFIEIAELAAALRSTSELALEASQQGMAFLSTLRKAWPHDGLERAALALSARQIIPVLPVSVALACAAHRIAPATALPLYLHSSTANFVNAALRLIPLGQTDGQIALAALETPIAETAGEALQATLADIGSAAFMIDIASMQHETQYTRLFRS